MSQTCWVDDPPAEEGWWMMRARVVCACGWFSKELTKGAMEHHSKQAHGGTSFPATSMYRVGKAKAGNRLDGELWVAWPN